ncbi:MAG: HNH endonuclease signature motif containing protein [Pseudomonadota bacterium]
MPKAAPVFVSEQARIAKDLRPKKEQARLREADARRPSSHARGYNYKWRKYRLAFLRENPLCVDCQQLEIIEAATEVDHIIPHRGDDHLFWDPDNHQALCKSCHSRKTATEDSSFAKRGMR